MSALPPALILDLLMILIVSQLGVALGQLWDVLGLPAYRIGGANLLPALLFVLALQPLARRLPIRFR